MARRRSRRRSSARRSPVVPFARRRRRGGGGGGGRGFLARFTPPNAVQGALGGAVGVFVANKFGPKVAGMIDKDGTSTIAPILSKIVLGAVGYLAAKRFAPAMAQGVFIGAVAEPIAGLAKNTLSQVGINGYLPEGVNGYLPMNALNEEYV